MTRDEASTRAAQLNAERPEGDAKRWMARKAEAETWEVVQVTVPGFRPPHPLKATVESKPRPPQADDPRPSAFRNAPFSGAG